MRGTAKAYSFALPGMAALLGCQAAVLTDQRLDTSGRQRVKLGKLCTNPGKVR